MIYTVTLNPALDCFLRPRDFSPGRVCRYENARFLPGGKGINVSLLLGSLGAETIAAGFSAGFTGRELEALLERAGCRTDFVRLETGLTRVNVKILPDDQPETALNGGGPPVGEEELLRLEEKLSALKRGDFLVLAGSIPAGLPQDVYRRLAEVPPEGVRVVIDVSGTALLEAAKAEPFLVKPNLEELGEAFGVSIQNKDQAEKYARKLQELGARRVAVTLGGGGAMLLTPEGTVFCKDALPGKEVSSVGAGDSFIAGFLYGWLSSEDEETALNWAVSSGAATAFSRGIAPGEKVRELYGRYFGRRIS